MRNVASTHPTQTGDSLASVATATLALSALGVVFGDLGTSPLYALQEAFHGTNGVAPTAENVIGVVSLFLWSLILMVSIKYVFVLMRADNHGEGGLLALLALLIGDRAQSGDGKRTRRWIYLAMIGTAMLYGDGVITPAISVLSALEGLEVATPVFAPYVVPLTVAILIGLFAVQTYGSGRVGVVFGPILAIWFFVIFILGLVSLIQTPGILAAINPANAVVFFLRNGWHGFLALGAVVLCLTGGEALYADMGHFGARPIRLAWYGLALPSLTINYLGQGALLLRDPEAASRPFYSMVPTWALYPMVALAALATVVASQALISAVFSLTRQATQLGLSPRFQIKHTSANTEGQIYLPSLNWLLMLATVFVVLIFKSSDRLAAAFGLAVSTTMAITTILFAALAKTRWKWSWPAVAAVAGIFMIADLAFVVANAMKFADGGWLPFAIGTLTFLLTFAWFTGIRRLRESRKESGLPLEDFVASLGLSTLHRVHGTAVFMMPPGQSTPMVLLHHLKHNQVLHERVVVLTMYTTEAPRVPDADRLTVLCMEIGFVRVEARYGYMEQANVPELLILASDKLQLPLYDSMTTSFYLGRESLVVTERWNVIKKFLMGLFVWMHKNELDATSHFGIPHNRVVEMGARVELTRLDSK
jgi:KUP system potassium uptake protein